MITFTGVGKDFGRGPEILRDVSFHLERGEFAYLTGPSGAGKSTLLRMIFARERPSRGRVEVGGQDVGALGFAATQALRRRIGVVFQDFRLIRSRDVFENVVFVLRVLGLPPREQKERALAVLKMVGLTHRMRARPEELSGGEQQRVAIARAVAADPEVLLADEPTGNLDPALARETLDLFRRIHSRGTTLLVATHDAALIRAVPRRVLHLEGGGLRDEPAP